ncbi:CotO family spore coat protein [Bacillus pumilus]|uniref:CotO family spore coat protein n=1 Tax=Bacillus TaxID=1386 RepID=UPI000D022A36|nr:MULTISPECIES: CotO family spore coat protein [Bacillus]MDF2002209.1 CotO family spore coat protein [Bacillus pumilus]MDF2023464.1 CotO family spore coat protein [Bacillus pumilus]MDF2027091.1 CotO family spore coat protein [Bacillus pumilus]MDF2088274.1 CotO family spore coat protein [Bacillus pumilus]PRS46823.1 spore coat protein [Bacillus sp. LNXM10]
MSNKGDENQKPLMYIVQPSYDESMPAMQNIVRKRKKSEKPQESHQSAKDVIEESTHEEPVAQEIEKKKEVGPPELQQEQDITQEAELAQEQDITQETEFTQEQDITKEAELTQEQDITQEAELTQEQDITQEPELIQERKPQREEEKPPEGVFHETKEEPRRKRVKKPLSQMSIDEKVDFLTSLPHNMPRALCLIEADGKTYRGIIMDRKEDLVVIRTAGGGNPVELAIDEISSIHPLGF